MTEQEKRETEERDRRNRQEADESAKRKAENDILMASICAMMACM